MSNNLVTEAVVGRFVTMKLRPPKGRRGKWTMLSGLVKRADQHNFVLERTIYDDWKCTERTVTNTIEQSRVMRLLSGNEIDIKRGR